MKVIALSSKAYEIVNEGQQAVKGISIWYINPMDKTEEGLIPLKLSVADNSVFTVEARGKFPCILELEFGMVAGKGNKASLKLVNLVRHDDVDLTSLL